MRILAFITEQDPIQRILNHLGMDATTPNTCPCRAPPAYYQDDLPFDPDPAEVFDPPWQDDVPEIQVEAS